MDAIIKYNGRIRECKLCGAYQFEGSMWQHWRCGLSGEEYEELSRNFRHINASHFGWASDVLLYCGQHSHAHMNANDFIDLSGDKIYAFGERISALQYSQRPNFVQVGDVFVSASNDLTTIKIQQIIIQENKKLHELADSCRLIMYEHEMPTELTHLIANYLRPVGERTRHQIIPTYQVKNFGDSVLKNSLRANLLTYNIIELDGSLTTYGEEYQ